MSVQHRKDSIRGMRLERLGIQPPSDWNNVEQVRAVKKQEIGAECSAAIYAGVDVGGSHYSLTEHDQTELLAQAQAVKEGAAAVPYHADGGTLPNVSGGGIHRAGAGGNGARVLSPDLLQPRKRVDCAGGPCRTGFH